MSQKTGNPSLPGSGDRDLERSLERIEGAWANEPGPEPPELVDLAVLNRARREAEAGRRSRRLRWLGGFASAAVIVLTLSIVVQQDQRPEPLPAPEANGIGLDPAERQILQTAEDEAFRDAPVASQAAPAAESVAREAAPAAAPMEQAARKMPKAETRMRADAAAPSPMLEEDGMSDRSGMDADSSDDAHRDSPEEWIDRLLRLKASGQPEQLARELAAFREAYPDHPLPPDLEQ